MPIDKPLALICYSAGSEACLMFAKAFSERGGNVQAIALLGPTFGAHDKSGTLQGVDYWLGEINGLMSTGVNIAIVHDVSGGQEGENITSSRFRYFDRRDQPHFDGGFPGVGSYNDPTLCDKIYNWIVSLSQ